MTQKAVLIFICLVSSKVYAVGPQSDPQIYSLAGQNKNQILMLSAWSVGRIFAEYEDYTNSTEQFFRTGQEVWIRCAEKTTKNRIAELRMSRGEMVTTALVLEDDPGCERAPVLLSNHPYPKQDWAATEPSHGEIEAIRAKLGSEAKLEVTKIATGQKGSFFLVLDPRIPSIYDVGGHRLLDEECNEVGMIDQAPIVPFIDLDGDSVPEFFVSSSDGLDAWLYRLYPQVDREMSHKYKGGV